MGSSCSACQRDLIGWDRTRTVRLPHAKISTLTIPIADTSPLHGACSIYLTSIGLDLELYVYRSIWKEWNEWIEHLISETDPFHELTLLHFRNHLSHLTFKPKDGDYVCGPRQWNVRVSVNTRRLFVVSAC
jgi:hypothetical protein